MRCTVTIITLNEAERLPAALASLAGRPWVTEIVVLDSGSTDATIAIAEAAGCRVIRTDWPGYGAQKNRAAEHSTTPWVLNLDADERVDAQLSSAIAALADAPPCSAYGIRRRNHVGGQPLRHWPWSWDTQVRLYDRTRTRFREAIVHESIITDGATPTLAGVLDHLTYRDWNDANARILRYAALWARDARARGKSPSALPPALRGLFATLREYLIRGHCLGGLHGLRWSRLHGRYAAEKYRLLHD